MPKFSLRGPRDWRLRGRKNLARLTAPEQPTNLIGVASRYLHRPVVRCVEIAKQQQDAPAFPFSTAALLRNS